MRRLAVVWSHAAGLFVDDLPFAGAVLAWLLCCCVILPRLSVRAPWAPAALVSGLALILLIGAVGQARRRWRASATKA